MILESVIIMRMIRNFFALCVIMIFASSAFAMQDIYHLYPYDTTNLNGNEIYNRYGYEGIDFNYQLRDMYPSTSPSVNVPDGQWFAVVQENYFRNWWYRANNQTVSGDIVYRRTLGGDVPEIAINSLADLLNDFNYVLVEEPEPYRNWSQYIDMGDYDDFPDPVEAFCVIIKNGEGELNLNFGNQYARHFPYWWGRGEQGVSSPNYVDWRNYTYDVMNGPLAYIISADRTSIYTPTRANQTNEYRTNFYAKISGDEVYNANGNLLWTISGDEVYDANGILRYTVDTENQEVMNTSGRAQYFYRDDTALAYTYIFNMAAIDEQVSTTPEDNPDLFGLSSAYNVYVEPEDFESVNPSEYLEATVTLNAKNSQNYSSVLGYINFQQRADLAYGYKNFSESSLVPLIVANVFDGTATRAHPLEFELRVFDANNNIVDVKRFDWNVDETNMPDIGSFYILMTSSSVMPKYETELRITNHTSTRYGVYRYDSLARNSADDIRPAYWEFDLPSDALTRQGFLGSRVSANVSRDRSVPSRFWLDSHSQIAPGLVTVYDNFAIDTLHDTSPIFSIRSAVDSQPHELRLRYKSITGVSAASPSNLYNGAVTVQGFYKGFADDTDLKDTRQDLANMMGLPPVMASLDHGVSASMPMTFTAGTGMLEPFEIHKAVPDGLISIDVIVSTDASGDIVDSIDIPVEIAVQPVKIRFKLSRRDGLIGDHWDELESASKNGTGNLLNKFSEFASIWFRSAATDRKFASLFTSMSRRGVSYEDCVNAFLYGDDLYLDFIVFIADSDWSHQEANKTAYINFFSDDNNRYILVGDGKIDKTWDLGVFVAANNYTDESTNTNDGNSEQSNSSVDPEYDDLDDLIERRSKDSSGTCNGFGLNLNLVSGILLVYLLRRKY